MQGDARPRLYFDFVDPGSWLMELRVARIAAEGGPEVVRVPFELRPPPEPLLHPDDPAWVGYWEDMAERLAAEGVHVKRPGLVPWTRKAHELVLHAAEAGGDPHRLRSDIFRRYHEAGEDIGRVDVLLDVAGEHGLDSGEVKPVLDVDRFAPELERTRKEALNAGVRGVPTLRAAGRGLEGIHDDDILRSVLGGDT